jgi:molybdopterin-biosynthesis enzyme MoeA-like protein
MALKVLFSDAGWHKQPNMGVPPMFQEMMEKAMEERDNEVQALKERVAVLEKIITDNHKSNNLAEEIERLRDRK